MYLGLHGVRVNLNGGASHLYNLFQVLHFALELAPLLLGHVSLLAHYSKGLSQLVIVWSDLHEQKQCRRKEGKDKEKDKKKSKRRIRGLWHAYKRQKKRETQQSKGTHSLCFAWRVSKCTHYSVFKEENKHAIFMRFAVDLLFIFMNRGWVFLFLVGGLIESSQSEEKLISTFPFSLDETELLTWALCLSFLHQSEALS